MPATEKEGNRGTGEDRLQGLTLHLALPETLSRLPPCAFPVSPVAPPASLPGRMRPRRQDPLNHILLPSTYGWADRSCFLQKPLSMSLNSDTLPLEQEPLRDGDRVGHAQGSSAANGMSQRQHGERDGSPSVSAAGQSKNSSNWLNISKSDMHLGWGRGEGAGEGLSVW